MANGTRWHVPDLLYLYSPRALSRAALQVKSSWLARKARPTLSGEAAADGSPPARATPCLRVPVPPYLAPHAPRRTFGERPCGAARFSNFVACGRGRVFKRGDRLSPFPPPPPGIVSARLFDPSSIDHPFLPRIARARRDRAYPDFRPDSSPTDRRGRRRRFRSRFAVRCFPSPAGRRDRRLSSIPAPVCLFVCFFIVFTRPSRMYVHRSCVRSVKLPPPSLSLVPAGHGIVFRVGRSIGPAGARE